MRSLMILFSVGLLTSAILRAEPPKGYHSIKIDAHNFTLPLGLTIEKVASTPQVERPVTLALDGKGFLYVADSSGSNEAPTKQVKNPTHRIVRLESSKKNGVYDKSTVFADKLSFLQGTLWHDGSLYVATPPSITKLTDTDGDGIAEKRETWFDGKTLTGCANDLHGPYAGPGDGRIYWTRGGFAEQELEVKGKKIKSRASRIFSSKPDGSDFRIEMTGGMDNPVDVAFLPNGEMFFTTTFVVNPANGQRDGIVHNTYGAVYGKRHDPALEPPRTRPELMGPMTHLGPAAPSGLHCYGAAAFGPDYYGNLFCTQFNLAKVSRHILKESGSTYTSTDSDFVTSDNRDFHPTDVIEDADGSLLIADTGGWYRLCCPSSVMEKKDVLGAIYRVRKLEPAKDTMSFGSVGSEVPSLKSDSLGKRRLAAEQIARAGKTSEIPAILEALALPKNDVPLDAALTQALIDLGDVQATEKGLESKSPQVRRAVLAALANLPDSGLKASDVAKFFSDPDVPLRETAWWIAAKRTDWHTELAPTLAKLLPNSKDPDLDRRLAEFASNKAVQEVLAEAVSKDDLVALKVMALCKIEPFPASWLKALGERISTENISPESLQLTLAALRNASFKTKLPDALQTELLKIVENNRNSFPVQFSALSLLHEPNLGPLFGKTVFGLSSDPDLPATVRRDALAALRKTELSSVELGYLARKLPECATTELEFLLPLFQDCKDPETGVHLLKSLSEPKIRAALRPEQLKPVFAALPKVFEPAVAELLELLESDRAELKKKLDDVLKDSKGGDVRKGQAVFNSAKAACNACHNIAYVGGRVGPDLTKIGSIRSERDLLEAILFPSATFVRSYEPVKVNLKDGKTYSGILKKDGADEIILTVSATEELKIDRKEIDELTPGTVSVMPAGLDQQLTRAELLDLLAFLKNLK